MISEKITDLLREHKFRGKLRLLEAITPLTGQRSCTIFGSKMSLDLGEYNQRRSYFGCHEEAEIQMLHRWLRPGMTVVDVGANLGYYTALFASSVGPGGTVISVEPAPQIYARLSAMVQGNRLVQVRTVNTALSDKSGWLELYVASPSNFSPTAASIDSPCATMKVPARTLDDLLDQNRIQTVDLLKLDTVGHEPLALAGASRTLAEHRIKAILCEFYWYWLQQHGYSVEDLWRSLLDAGFEDPVDQTPPPPRENTLRFLQLAS
ncbi:MAG: FkbM family methyltransferase [Candidatus Binataceae bacterium]